MTLYQQIQQFYRQDKFRFDERTKKQIGARLARLWKELHGNDPRPPIIDSIEDTGTYRVFDYPSEFTTIIYQLIRTVHREILTRAKEKRLKEAVQTQIPPPLPPVVNAPPKIRNRIPVKAKPVYKS